MSDEQPSERISPPDYRGFTILHDERVGMSAQELLDRAGEVLAEWEEELAVLHRQLPRKSEARLKRTNVKRRVLIECIAGARARVTIAGDASAGLIRKAKK